MHLHVYCSESVESGTLAMSYFSKPAKVWVFSCPSSVCYKLDSNDDAQRQRRISQGTRSRLHVPQQDRKKHELCNTISFSNAHAHLQDCVGRAGCDNALARLSKNHARSTSCGIGSTARGHSHWRFGQLRAAAGGRVPRARATTLAVDRCSEAAMQREVLKTSSWQTFECDKTS